MDPFHHVMQKVSPQPAMPAFFDMPPRRNVLSTEYKGAWNSLKLYERFRFESKDFSVNPGIAEIQPFSLTVYKCDEKLVPSFWNEELLRNNF